ncbi:hypothetical protein P692DRAFT_20821481, partial [Suillus brevipes Sb2]
MAHGPGPACVQLHMLSAPLLTLSILPTSMLSMSRDSSSLKDFPTKDISMPSRLDYLDLHGEIKDYFEIKLAVAFEFVKVPGQFCSKPSMTAAVLSSCPLKNQDEVVTATIIHDIWLHRLVPLVRERWFCWDTVELPEKQRQSM